MQEHADLDFTITLPRLKAMNAKQALKELALRAAKETSLPEEKIYKKLLAQSAEPPCAIGNEIALLQIQTAEINKSFTALATTIRDLPDFPSPDGSQVKIMALVMSPRADGPLHLRRLARISRALKNEKIKENILKAKDDMAVRAAISLPGGWPMAA